MLGSQLPGPPEPFSASQAPQQRVELGPSSFRAVSPLPGDLIMTKKKNLQAQDTQDTAKQLSGTDQG